LDAAGVVGLGADFFSVHEEVVVMFGTFEGGSGEARADFEALGGGDGEHRFGEVGFEAVEDGFAKSWRAAADDAFDGAADGVAFGTDFLDTGDHGLGSDGVASADDVGFDVGGGDGERVDFGLNILHGFDPGDGFEVGGEMLKDFFGDGSGGDAADGFAGGRSPATLPVTGAVFGIVGVVGVGGTVFFGHLGVGFGAVVLVAYQDGDGRAEGFPFKGAGEDFALVGLVTWSGDFGLAGTAAVEFDLEVGFGEGDEGRAAIDDDADATSMGFTES